MWADSRSNAKRRARFASLLLYDKNALTLAGDGTGRGMLITYTVVLSFLSKVYQAFGRSKNSIRIQAQRERNDDAHETTDLALSIELQQVFYALTRSGASSAGVISNALAVQQVIENDPTRATSATSSSVLKVASAVL